MRWVTGVSLGLMGLGVGCASRVIEIAPPVPVDIGRPAPTPRPVEVGLAGQTRLDEWAWMGDVGSPEMVETLQAEVAWARAQLAPLAALRQELLEDAKSRQPDAPLVGLWRGDGLRWKVELWDGEHSPTWSRCDVRRGCVAFASVADVAPRATRLRWGPGQPSPSGDAVALVVDPEGDGDGMLYVAPRGPRLTGVAGGAVWSSDGRWLFFTRADASGRPWQVWRRPADDDADSEQLVFEEPDPRFHVSLRGQGGQLWLTSSSASTDEVHRLSLDAPDADPQRVWPRSNGVTHRSVRWRDRVYTLTNLDAPRGRIVVAPLESPEAWEEFTLQPLAGLDALIGLEAVTDGLVVTARVDGAPRLQFYDLTGGGVAPRPWSVWPHPHEVEVMPAEPGASSVLLRASAWTHLPVWMQFGPDGLQPVDSDWGLDPRGRERFVLETDWVTARDELSEISVTVLRLEDVPLDGTAPLYLMVADPEESGLGLDYRPYLLTLAAEGVVVARVHPRSAEAGALESSQLDALASAERSVADTLDVIEAWAGSRVDGDRVVLHGRGAGGATVGALLNRAPDRVHAAVLESPVMDLWTDVSQAQARRTAWRQTFWGDPSDPAVDEALRAYAPYDNITTQAYPEVLVLSGGLDKEVSCASGAKWVQRVRARRSDDGATLLHVDPDQTDQWQERRWDALERGALRTAWIVDVLGIRE